MAVQTYGPLRIVRRLRAFGDQKAGVAEYFERLALMAPAEVTGFYLTFRPVVIGDKDPATDEFVLFWPVICLLLAIFVRAWATRKNSSLLSAQPVAVAVAALAFLFWVLAMGHQVSWLSSQWPFTDTRAATIGAAIFTFVIPYFYKGDPPPAPQPNPNPAPGPAPPPNPT